MFNIYCKKWYFTNVIMYIFTYVGMIHMLDIYHRHMILVNAHLCLLITRWYTQCKILDISENVLMFTIFLFFNFMVHVILNYFIFLKFPFSCSIEKLNKLLICKLLILFFMLNSSTGYFSRNFDKLMNKW